MGRYEGGTDSADPLRIMRLTRGPRGARTEPQVGMGPTFIILTVFPIGFMVLLSGLRWPFYQSLQEVPNWKWKIAGSLALGLSFGLLFITHYEVNHAFQHGNSLNQRQAIIFGERGPKVNRDLWEEEKLWQRKVELERAKAGR